MLQSIFQRELQVRAAAQTAGPHEIKRALNSAGIRGDWRGLKRLRLAVEQDEIEVVRRPQGPQQSFQSLIAALEFLPLHR